MNDYYTYCYLTVSKRPYYIGMGRGYRATRQHPTLDVSIPDDPALIIILKSGLTQEEAWKHEEHMIAVLGRQCDGGLLFNKARGGAGWRPALALATPDCLIVCVRGGSDWSNK